MIVIQLMLVYQFKSGLKAFDDGVLHLGFSASGLCPQSSIPNITQCFRYWIDFQPLLLRWRSVSSVVSFKKG
jgi:hypothetical protein